MNKKKGKIIGYCFIFAALAAVVLIFVNRYMNQEEYILPLIETTDIHGTLVDISSGDESVFEYRLAYFAKCIDKERERGDIVLLDGGDLYQENLLSNMVEGNSIKAYLDLMKYDGICIGNHEFDWGLYHMLGSDGTVGEYYLTDTYSGKCDTPILCWDIYDSAGGERIPNARDYVILSKTAKSASGRTKNVKVAVFGYVDDYSSAVSSSRMEGYEIHPDDIRAIEEKAAKLEKTGQIDASILLCHVSSNDMDKLVSDQSVIDLVLCGHDHKPGVGKLHNGVTYMNGGSHAQTYARAELVVKNSDVSVRNQNIVSLIDNPEAMQDRGENSADFDKEIFDLSHAAIENVFEQWPSLRENLGYISTSLSGDVIEGSDNDTVKSNWSAYYLARSVGADIGIQNFYGVKGNLVIGPGKESRTVTGADIRSIFPFGNDIYKVGITYGKLLELLNHRYLSDVNDYEYLVFSNVLVYYDNEHQVKKFYLDDKLIYDGTWVESKDTQVSIAINSYLMGLGCMGLEDCPLLNNPEEAPDSNTVTEYLLKEYGEGHEIYVDTSMHFCIE